jgi:hypothetical protein
MSSSLVSLRVYGNRSKRGTAMRNPAAKVVIVSERNPILNTSRPPAIVERNAPKLKIIIEKYMR